ncbi:hypothetical protein [Pedosphaera parvula]|uniref:Uncharacterized protein n=1 Tax=Pedosphaera parvula (strain Ellin514) TaxID=320771 RepID=B9XI39_PEDPL|nr:hypothetical protein [Pedosphaera parvula]EEF60532.1 conserved hypothetical protein [Pedosphaera parvula Ellin514]
MAISKHLSIWCLGFTCLLAPLQAVAESIHAGPLFDEFDLTLAPGHRVEAAGPFFYSEQKETQHQWAIPPFFSRTTDPTLEYEEYDFLYPLLTYDKFGKETRWQIGQLFNFATGGTQSGNTNHRFALFPIYIQQRSVEPGQNYTSVLPFYGHLRNRLFRDEINFVMMPFYVETRKRDVVTKNMPYPIFHLRHGNGLKGWQVLPLAGHEHKDVTSSTNGFGDVTQIPGHDRRFILWPIYSEVTADIGTENISHQRAIIPFYVRFHSKNRDSTSILWPFFTWTDDREKGYREYDMPWPFVAIARGPGKTITRFWPIYSEAHSTNLVSNTYLWPVYKYNRILSSPLDRERTRILLFLYSDTREKNTDTGVYARRVAFLPFFTHRWELNGNERLQVLSLLEPFFPTNKSIERNYSQVYALWRSEKNPRTKASSQSLLWNLYRHEASPEKKKLSLLFGLVQYQSTGEGKHWRVCYIPMGKEQVPSPEDSKGR